MARMALAAMDSSESVEMPLDYLQGHKDGLEWAAQLAESNHPETGDWLYDDPIELAKAIRKGPDMPPAQPAADSEPVAIIDQANLDYLRSGADADVWPPEREEMGDVLLYRHAQPALVVQKTAHSSVIAEQLANVLSDMKVTDHQRAVISCAVDRLNNAAQFLQLSPSSLLVPEILDYQGAKELYNYLMTEEEINATVNGWNACRAAMLAAAPHDTPALNSVQSVVTVPDKWIPVSEQMPEVGDIVLTAMGGVVNVGEMECSAANFRFFTSVISGRELPATHWMPLPAAPQEVK
ncbi:TPA: DUF551 domain-containing protein [Klebsiella pneumoniae]|nr:DUF551 domain-containing protein [Klebsiella pneumoniae]